MSVSNHSKMSGANWRTEALQMFGSSGSYGNGAAMRVAPLGAFFADDLKSVQENAIVSAQPPDDFLSSLSANRYYSLSVFDVIRIKRFLPK